MGDDLKGKLSRIEADLAAARAKLPALEQARNDARDAYAGTESTATDTPEFLAAEQAVKNYGEAKDDVANLQAAQVGVLRMMGEDPAVVREQEQRTGGGAPGGAGGGAERWNSDVLFADSNVKDMLTYASTSKSRFGSVDLGQVVSRDALAAEIGGTTFMRQEPYYGVVPQLRRILRVIDLLPTGTMERETLPYTQESGSFETAVEVSEGSAKAEGAVTFTDEEAAARTIAHYLKLQKQSLSDYPALRTIIDSRLRYGVERRLEAQVLQGNGTPPNIKGIYKQTGVTVVKFVSAATQPADMILKAITAIFLADGVADGIAMHPTNWEAALIAKSTFEASAGVTGGSGEYIGGGPFMATPAQLWGVPLVASASVPLNAPLVGDFAMGATLFIREGVNVLLSDSDQDDFIKNRVTMLGEMRAALAVWKPAIFAKAYLTKAAEEAAI